MAPHEVLRGRFGYTYLDSIIVDSTSPTSAVLKAGQSLFRRPKNSGYVGVTWHDSRLTVDLDRRHHRQLRGQRLRRRSSPAILLGGNYSTWDARFAYKLTPKVAVTAAIDNLANASYMQPLGYPALERAFRVGLRVGF